MLTGASVRRRALPALLVAAFVVIAAGCTEPAPKGLGGSCELNSECDTPLVCRLERCRRECGTVRDCPIEALCVTDEEALGACTLPEEEDCVLDSDCPAPLLCKFGRCLNECEASADCPAGAQCDDGACVDPVEDTCSVDSDCTPPLVCAADRRCREQCITSRDCRAGTTCQDGTCVRPPRMDAGFDAGTDAGPPDAGPPDSGPPDAGPQDAGFDAGGRWDASWIWRDAGTDAGPEIMLCPGGTCDPVPNATVTCVAGSCEIASCDGTWLDCDGVQTNGCEINGNTHRDHCGGCGAACPAGQACLDGACADATVVDIAVGDGHACAAWSTGDVTCWGSDGYAQLGDGPASGDRQRSPVDVIGLDDAVDIEAGGNYTCALRSGGTVACWGQNHRGQLGDGSFTRRDAPVAVTGLTGVDAIDTDTNTVCARLTSGELRCWGDGDRGRLGAGTGVSSTPIEPTGVGTVTEFAVGKAACAVQTSGDLICWGDNSQGTIDADNPDWSIDPPEPGPALDGLSVTVADMDLLWHGLVVGDDGRLYSWGRNNDFECGVLVFSDTVWPPREVAGITDVVQVSNLCAVTGGGSVYCWGNNQFGHAGIGTYDYPLTTPARALGVTDAVQVDIAKYFACIRHAAGYVSCSGGNSGGQLGDGTTRNRALFAPVRGMP